MESQEIIECLEVLRKKSSWLSFQKEDVSKKLECLDVFKERGNPQHIVYLFEFLKSSNVILRDKTAFIIVSLFETVKTQTEFYESLKYSDFEIEDFNYYKNSFSADVYLHLLAIASLNKSGYVREKAVNEIAETLNPKAIRFIIFRLGDWVKNVREAARKAIRKYFQPIFIDEFLEQLPLIQWLLRVERTDLSDIYFEINNFISDLDFNEVFYRKLKTFDDKTKVIYVRNYLKYKSVTKKIFQLLSDEKLFLIKIELLRHIEKLDEETQKLFVGKFLKDRSAKVRVYAIYSTKPFRAEFYDEILNSIFDISASVRELARFILRESSIDFAELYRKQLIKDENFLGAILGLSEVRTNADLPIFENYIQKPNVKIKVACLSAINALNKNLARSYALNLLSHSSAKVRNKSTEILASMPDNEVLEKARTVYQQGDYEQKKTILKMFGKTGGWKIIGDFIIALSDDNKKIQELGWMNLEKWRRRQSFIKPTREEIVRANNLYDEFDKTNPQLDSSRKKLWEELPFYLR